MKLFDKFFGKKDKRSNTTTDQANKAQAGEYHGSDEEVADRLKDFDRSQTFKVVSQSGDHASQGGGFVNHGKSHKLNQLYEIDIRMCMLRRFDSGYNKWLETRKQWVTPPPTLKKKPSKSQV